MIEYLILGLVQGLTEFLPVSSSGHLYLLQYTFGMEPGIELEILLHVASLVAVVCFFWRRIWQMMVGVIPLHLAFPRGARKSFPRGKDIGWGFSEDGMLGLKIIVATIFTIPTALLIEHYMLYDLSIQVVAWSLIVTGLLVWVSHVMSDKQHATCNMQHKHCHSESKQSEDEESIRQSERSFVDTQDGKTIRDFSWIFVILVGLAQGFAVLPGISRSGLTIAVLLILGLRRKQSAEISFLLSIPTILGALVFLLKDLEVFPQFSLPLILALILCTVVSWLTIKFMLRTIERCWIYFVPYCVLLGVGLLLLS